MSDGPDPKPPSAKPAGGKPAEAGGYFASTELPLQSLCFVLPFIVAYEVGIRWLAQTDPGGVHGQVVAFSLMQRFFLWTGGTGAMLPALAVAIILLACHVVRKDAWTLRPVLWMGMLVESIILTAPLLAVGMALPTHLPLWNIDRATTETLILACGAGVYEELVFRLIGMTLITLVLSDLLRIPSKTAIVISAFTTAVIFALYHYLGQEPYHWRSMVFRTAAGLYFSTLLVFRGFGVTVGAHAIYDISIVALRHFAADP